MSLRIVQWTTGNVARQTVRAVLARPDMELVGAYAHSAEKVGEDVADLVGLDEATGVLATSDVEALLGLRPDCVVYNPLHFDVEEVCRLLAGGANVVTTAEFLSGRAVGADGRASLERAAVAGGASLFGSGMNPGFAQLLAAVASGISNDIRRVTMTESVDLTLYDSDANMQALGFGRPAGDPGHAEAVEAATLVFAEGVDALAAMLGYGPGEIEPRCTVEFGIATQDVAAPGRVIPAGRVAAIDLRWEGFAGARSVVEIHQRWVMGAHLDPPWKAEHAYLVEVDGDPQIRMRFEIWPDQDLAGLTPEDMHVIGMRITAMPTINAIPAVCAAAPGIRSYRDLPLVAGRPR